VARAAEEAGLEDYPLTFLDRATPSYSAILEPDGNLVTALADMALYDLVPARRLLTSRFLARLDRADLLLADANLPEDSLSALCEAARQRTIPVAAIAVSPAKVVRWQASLPALTLLAMNIAEAATLTGHPLLQVQPGLRAEAVAKALMQIGLVGGMISDGSGPVMAFAESEILSFSPPPLAHLADVTGAGDALASGFIDGWLAGGSLASNLARGIALARLTLEAVGPVRQDLSAALLAQTLAAMPEPG
jgi:pseudouridine kinase